MNNVEITATTANLSTSSTTFGGESYTDKLVARGTCSYCQKEVGLRQVGSYESSEQLGYMVAVRCDNCHSIMAISLLEGESTLHPAPDIQGLSDIPKGIENYYQEALDCLSARAPNGAVTLFRKTIHAIAIHYGIADIDESMGIYEMVNELHDSGEINEKLRKSLLAVKDLGNDGAHINENEPDMEQAFAIKELIDAVLSATVIADQRMEYAREHHPNEFAEDSG